MTILHGQHVNGRPRSISLAGGGSGTTGTVTTITLADWSGTGSPGFARQGMTFRQGDIPPGHVPVIQRGGAAIAHQWNQVVTYADGSWKFAVFSLRDTAFSANESRTYTVIQQAGTVPASTGLSLPSALAGHTFQAKFTSVTSYDGTNTATYGGGALTADLTTHIATSTRITKMADGPVAPCWKVWGMASSDAHLKTNWYVIPWLNADGSVYAIELCAVVAQDWWSIAGKYRLNYDAALVDGASAIALFSGVQHPYGSHWAFVRTVQDNNYCRAPWIGGAMPTLTYGFDRAYWVQCAPVPPFDTTLSPAAYATSLPPFTPCRGVALDPSTVENIDGEGASGTRGLVTQADANAFMRQGAFDYALSRAQSQSALHAFVHFRSNRSRTRPGESTADTANSVIPLILQPKAAAQYDFTSAGLPIATHSYADPNTSTSWTDGYVQPVGGRGYWTHNYPDSSHLYAYAYMIYLFEGSPWMLESGILDWAMFTAQQQAGQNYAQGPLLLDDYRANGHPLFANMPQVIYTGLTVYSGQSNGRAMAWAINLVGQAGGIVPDGHEASGFMRLFNQHQADWIAQSLIYVPSSMQASGDWMDLSPTGNFRVTAIVSPVTPFFSALITLAALFNYRLTGVAGFKSLGLMTANRSVKMAAQGCYFLTAYRYTSTKTSGVCDFLTNNFVDPALGGFGDTGLNDNAGTYGYAQNTTLTIGDQFNEGFVGGCQLPLAVGDTLYFNSQNNFGDSSIPIPNNVNEGQLYYIVGTTSSYGGQSTAKYDQVQVSTTANGTPINFGTAQQTAYVQLRPASASAPVATSPPDVPGGDCYVFIHYAALTLAAANGHSTAPAMRDKVKAFLAPSDLSTYMPSALVS